ncbi:RsmB/NOP family class I SAM-dependent RNA methyltransferase [Caenispirillum salinarum]|uniref:RsmB/NOP family class I SAM-dependent RNA methyltransferase n=1 Tax=Caenispirillum salinarum TaxID=859058 RepID=UPI00384B7C8B
MHDAARLQAAIDLLGEIESVSRPADGTASAFFRSRRFIGSKDRRAIADRVWGVLRRWARLTWWCHWAAQGAGREGMTVSPRLRVIADLLITDHLKVDAVDRLFSGQTHAPDRMRAAEAAVADLLQGRSATHRDMPPAVRFEVPDWIYPRFEALFGADTDAELAAMLPEAPVDLRVNTLKAQDRAAALAALAADGVEASATDLSPLGLRLPAGRVNLPTTQAFKDGLVEVQDEGSQLIALLTDARPGMAVVDFCAGAGGKTLGLAAGMDNKGRLIACDVSEGRLERSAVRLKRAGAHNVTRRVLASESDKWVKRHAKGFDRVLVDAPCTGTGTWRRNPDARWRLSPEQLDDLTKRQASILDSARRLVKPGGRLVYATCSLLPEENADQVEAFLERWEDAEGWRVLPVCEVWDAAVGTDCPMNTYATALRLTPARHGTDGFFTAVLERGEG